ncbi:MAG: TIGR03960 family B12-binding radical SAM protein [Oscillospiraceae bacterium]|nr:TIGR03960 family B12-binding radical SAM protein [Oscillospiraceae bacterium]
MNDCIEALLPRILPRVQKPARYVGGEYNQTVKELSQVELRVAFCFPDTYEIGMSNLGIRILYGIMNQMPGVWCERVFTPWGDMEAEMRAAGLPLYALESHDPVADFDLIAFSVGYEMSYTNILTMLDLAGVPLHAAERESLHNIVFAGGACTYNPEPLVDFVDFFSLGEGEESTVEILECYRSAKRRGLSKEEFLWEVGKIPGVYVPTHYEHRYNADGTLEAIVPLPGAPEKVTKRIVQDLDKAYYPVEPIVQSTEIVHDRQNLEVMRGCIRGCRFCQAGYTYRPVRPRSPETLYEQAVRSLEFSGDSEITLSSLSTSDYKYLEPLTERLTEYCAARNINMSVPSLRADNFSRELMLKLQKVRKSGLTFAPEAGTQRLRDAINKNVTEEDVLKTCEIAFAGGWNNVKLYFMLGLPTETDEDVLGIAELVYKIYNTWKACASNKKRGVRIHVAVAFFVPKPFTGFQWEQQLPPEEYLRRCRLLKEHLNNKSVEFNYHEAQLSELEAVLARGDRRLGAVIEAAWRRGAKLDGWMEYFDYDKWIAALADCGVDRRFYTTRGFGTGEVLAWDTIDPGVRKDFLLRERERAYRSQITPDCRRGCAGCGANHLLQGGVCEP